MFYQIGRITVFSLGYVPVLERLVPSSGGHSAYELDVGCLLASLRI